MGLLWRVAPGEREENLAVLAYTDSDFAESDESARTTSGCLAESVIVLHLVGDVSRIRSVFL